MKSDTSKKLLFRLIKIAEELVFIWLLLVILLRVTSIIGRVLSYEFTQAIMVVGLVVLICWHEFFFKKNLHEKIREKMGIEPPPSKEAPAPAVQEAPAEEAAAAEETPAE